MMDNLHKWANGGRPSLEEISKKNALLLPLTATSKTIDIPRFMGRWYVAANIPTIIEVGASNCVESYKWDEANQMIKVFFDYVSKGSSTPSQSLMRARIANGPINSQWALNFKLGIYLPFDLTYLIVDVAEDYSWAIIGVPDRSYFWVLVREKPVYSDEVPTAADRMNDETSASASAASEGDETILQKYQRQQKQLDSIIESSVDFGFDQKKIVRVPWLKSLEFEPTKLD